MIITRDILLEKVDESSPASFVIRKLKEYGFKLLHEHEDDAEHYGFICYTNLPNDPRDIFTKVSRLCNIAKWEITASGGYYDGLRSYYHVGKDIDPDISMGTFFMRMEPSYGDPILGEFPVEPGERSYFGIGYEKFVFYHTTKRKYVPKILKNGLIPKNGNELTNWRDTKERVYLSTLPDFGDDPCNYANYLNPDPDDPILLKVDLRGRGGIKYYVDESYSNAVYTYDCISPECIEVMEGDDVAFEFESAKLLDRMIHNKNNIIEANPHILSFPNNRRKIMDHIMKRISIGKNTVPREHLLSILDDVYDDAASRLMGGSGHLSESAADGVDERVRGIIVSCLGKCNDYLKPYGLSVVFNYNYDFGRREWLAVYQGRSVKNGGKIRVGVNFPLLIKAMKKYGVDDMNLQIFISIWHEVGHGIVEWIKSLRRKDTQMALGMFTKTMRSDLKVITDNEEEIVEEFGAYMSDWCMYSDLNDFMTDYGDVLIEISKIDKK